MPEKQNRKKNRRHVPQVLRLMGGDSGFRIRDLLRQSARIGRLVISSAGLRRQLLQQFAILFPMKVLSHAVLTPESQNVAA